MHHLMICMPSDLCKDNMRNRGYRIYPNNYSMIGILANCIIVDILEHHRMVGNTHEVSRQITDHELKMGDSVTDGAKEAEEGTMALRSLSQTCPQLVNLGDDGSDGDDHDVD